MMIAVATGGPKINTVNAEYVERHNRILSELNTRGLQDPNPHEDLWSWYGAWSSGDLPTWQSRREHVKNIYHSLFRQLTAPYKELEIDRPVGSTGWPRVDRVVDRIRQHIAAAQNEEDFQNIGLLCRETLVSLCSSRFSNFRCDDFFSYNSVIIAV